MNNKIFLDSNIFLRFLVPEDSKSFQGCQQIFERIAQGTIFPYTSDIVITEVIFTLIRTYKFAKTEIIKDVLLVFELRNMVVIEKTDTKKAFGYYKQLNIKFGDCLIATQIPQGVIICTYDQEFEKIPGIKTTTPTKLLQ